MSRFHRKYHAHTHHTTPLSNYPDSAYDPIASQSRPFNGNFYINGNLIADQMVLDDARINVGTFESLSAIDLNVSNLNYQGNILNSSTYTDGVNGGYVGLGYQGHNVGPYSVTMGFQNSALQSGYSISAGYRNIAGGPYSFAFGAGNKVIGPNCASLGVSNIITENAYESICIGASNYIDSAIYAITLGYNVSATEELTIAMGGVGTHAKHYHSFIYSSYEHASTNRFFQYLVSAYGGVDLGNNVIVYGKFNIKDSQGADLLESDDSTKILKNYYNQTNDSEKLLSSFIINPPIVKKSNFNLSAFDSTGILTADSNINLIKYAESDVSKVNLPILSAYAALQKSLIASDPALSAQDYGLEIKFMNKTSNNIYLQPNGDTIDGFTSGQAYGLSANAGITLIGDVKSRQWWTF
jgi:hypothetical protein